VTTGGALPATEPHLLIENDSDRLHELDSFRGISCVHDFAVVGTVVNESTSQLLTKIGVLTSIHQEGVPPDVNLLRRNVRPLGVHDAQLKILAGCGHDSFSLADRDILLLLNTPDKPAPENRRNTLSPGSENRRRYYR
jgi:hypothetical protein